MKKENWKDIPGYEGFYQVSDLGRVRSLDREVKFIDGRHRKYEGGLMEAYVGRDGYRRIGLRKVGSRRTIKVSRLVAMAFLGNRTVGMQNVVDHINGDKTDDSRENLRIVTQRANTSTCYRSDRETMSSKYAGVSRGRSNWEARIMVEGKPTYLGSFDEEIEASKTYQKTLAKTLK